VFTIGTLFVSIIRYALVQRRIVGHVDHHGEIHEGVVTLIARKRKNGFASWLAMSQEAMIMLAKADLSNEQRRVLFYLLGIMEYENGVRVTQTEIAVALNMYRQQVNRAMSRLLQDGIILRIIREGVKVGYKFNPNYCWRGSAKNHVIALKDHRPLVNP
jgi:predicted transcriptional regulator